VYSDSEAIIATKTIIAVIGHRRTLTIAHLSQYKCINIAIINPALISIKNIIKDHLRSPWKPYQSTKYEKVLNTNNKPQIQR
jgi:hypothetical protein